jgi:hypothetical protein
MARRKTGEVTALMSQMDLDLQNYVLDMLRHIKSTQEILLMKKRKKLQQMEKREKND